MTKLSKILKIFHRINFQNNFQSSYELYSMDKEIVYHNRLEFSKSRFSVFLNFLYFQKSIAKTSSKNEKIRAD